MFAGAADQGGARAMAGIEPIKPSRIHTDMEVAAGLPWSARIAKGDTLRIVDLEGKQAVDFLCYNFADPSDRYNAANSIKLNHNIYLGQGAVLWSVRANKLMTIVADTCGSHDTIYGCCSIEVDDVRFGKNNGAGCQGNFERELSRHGLGAKDIVANINFFMNVPVRADGGVAIVEGRSRAGDYVELRAEMDVLAVLSNCPERLNQAAGFNPTPIRVAVFTP
jgi:urea carboxylase-associated protein 1